MRGFLIQCGSCGKLESISLEGTAEEIEGRVNGEIQKGWRYVRRTDCFICPECRSDKESRSFYEACYGRQKPETRQKSYIRLMSRALENLRAYKELDEWTAH